MHDKRSAFTLIEVVIAAAILAVAVVGMLAAVVNCHTAIATAREKTIAIAAVQQKLEEVRNTSFSAIDNFDATTFDVEGLSGPDGDDPGDVLVSQVPIEDPPNPDSLDNLLRIDVTVTWESGGRTLSTSALTYRTRR